MLVSNFSSTHRFNDFFFNKNINSMFIYLIKKKKHLNTVSCENHYEREILFSNPDG